MPVNKFHSQFAIALGMLLLMTAGTQAAGLSGTVTSQAEPTMEGVLVTAKKEGSSISVTVVTDALGKFSFPPDRLDAGKYNLSIRAVGYILDGPKDITLDQTTDGKADLKLSKTKNLASQLSNAEWIMSIPAPDKDKKFLDDWVLAARLMQETKAPIIEANFSCPNEGDFVKVDTRTGDYVERVKR